MKWVIFNILNLFSEKLAINFLTNIEYRRIIKEIYKIEKNKLDRQDKAKKELDNHIDNFNNSYMEYVNLDKDF